MCGTVHFTMASLIDGNNDFILDPDPCHHKDMITFATPVVGTTKASFERSSRILPSLLRTETLKYDKIIQQPERTGESVNLPPLKYPQSNQSNQSNH